jgi:hypothetical protein
MELIDPVVFPTAVFLGKEQLSKIAKLIGKYIGEYRAKKFTNAYLDFDTSTSIEMLDDLMIAITGCKNTMHALNRFAEKFPSLNPELSGAVAAKSFEYEKVVAIDQYYDQMKRIIEGK